MTNFKKFHLLQHLQVIGTRHSDAKLKWRHTVKEVSRRVPLAQSVQGLEQYTSHYVALFQPGVIEVHSQFQCGSVMLMILCLYLGVFSSSHL